MDARTAELLEAFAAHLDGAGPAPAISDDDAVAVTEVLHAELERGVAARNAQAATLGRTIACAEGCSACCETVIFASDADAVRIARWLDEHPDARARFVAAYPSWRAAAADLIERASGGDGATVRAAMSEAMSRHLMCPFNHAGLCDVYAVRPDTCRVAHALDTSAECRPGGRAVVLDFVPITRFLERVRALQRAMQAGRPLSPLADNVHARL